MGNDQEIFTLEEMSNEFSFDKVSLGGPVFDLKKLGWLNNQYMKQKDIDELVNLAKPYFEKVGYVNSDSAEELETLKRVLLIARESCDTLADLPARANIYYEDDITLPEITEDMNKKQRKSVDRLHKAIASDEGKKAIKVFLELMELKGETLSEEESKEILNAVMEKTGEGPGKVLMPLRVVISGKASGPDLYTVMSIIGKRRVLDRVNGTIKKYEIL